MLATGIVLGTMLTAGFIGFVESSNTLDFCISCHETEKTVYQEYRKSAHFQNRTGVRATRADCHVPREWWPKLVRKLAATNELFHWPVHRQLQKAGEVEDDFTLK